MADICADFVFILEKQSRKFWNGKTDPIYIINEVLDPHWHDGKTVPDRTGEGNQLPGAIDAPFTWEKRLTIGNKGFLLKETKSDLPESLMGITPANLF